MELGDVALLALALATAGAIGFVLGREAGINKGWRDAHEFFDEATEDARFARNADPSYEAGA